MMKTYSMKPAEVEKTWYIVDAEDLVLGRMASEIAKILRGKHKAGFTPMSIAATTSSSSTRTRSS